jgi:hypothetical protein
MFKHISIGILIGALVMSGVWGLVHMLSDNGGAETLVSEMKMPGNNKGVLDMICELELDLDGQLALGIKESEPSRITMAQVDFEKKSGWYQGTIAISESRAGTLTLMGTQLKVSRPAMFQRFGVMINREEFVVDRKTGRFTQTLGIQDGRTVTLIKGTCAKVIKPPF